MFINLKVFNMRLYRLRTLWFILAAMASIILQNEAYACFDGANNCHTSFSGTVKSKFCGGRTLPQSRTRNFDFRSWRLSCSSNADHFMRRPQKYDYNEWGNLDRIDPEAAFRLRRSMPLIQWSGTIPYQTVEEWRWEECSYGTSSIECGSNRVCHTETDRTCDDKGKCTETSREVCEDVACSCWYDHTRSESLHCSNETMDFKSEFVRPSEREWNLKIAPIDAVFLPNKYDLLPAEYEDVQIFNNESYGTVLSPVVMVGNAWNKYAPQIEGSGKGASCRMNNPTSINVRINTLERDRTRATPNPFKAAVNQFGETLDAVKEWKTETVDGKEVKVRPKKIQLMDSTGALVESIAAHSRRVAEREEVKEEKGLGENPDGFSFTDAMKETKGSGKTDQNAKEGFFKNTQVRLRLKKINKAFWFDSWTFNKKYSDDGVSIVPGLHVFSENQNVANSDRWELNLEQDGSDGNTDFYRAQKLIPNRNYNLMLSVYQKGVPFYQADCDTRNEGWSCNGFVRAIGLGIGENDYFSKDIEVPFSTGAEFDERNYIISGHLPNDTQGIPYLRWILNPERIFELVVSEKPSQATKEKGK